MLCPNKTEKHTDIKSDGWIEKYLLPDIRPYAYLMRLDRPIGTWLLLLPSLWAIMLVAGGGLGINGFILSRLILFGIGAIIMRGAGCVVNDLWDRKFDKMVERTSARPLAAGTVTTKQAILFLIALLAIGFAILLQMSLVTVLLGFMVFPMVVMYPLMKRWTWWPQLFLGLTFNFGVLMGWTAVNDVISPAPMLLYIGAIFWTLGYDTIYAHQDKEDDMKIGLKSTALRFGENSKNIVTVFYAMTALFFTLAFIEADAGNLSLILLIVAFTQLKWQLGNWNMNDQQSSLNIFKSNRDFGMLVLIAAIL